LPPELRHLTEHVIGLKDFQIDGDAVKTSIVHISAPTNRTVNGQVNPTIHIRPGETQLWRLANISANIYYNVGIRGQKFQVIGHDGFPVDRIWSADSLLLAAGARFDVPRSRRPTRQHRARDSAVQHRAGRQPIPPSQPSHPGIRRVAHPAGSATRHFRAPTGSQ
jgi:FtsP/CotA-like multicopper oxidase with cupredoxin domain